jgi:RNA polymerase sigma-70 factor (ECF subfamily)
MVEAATVPGRWQAGAHEMSRAPSPLTFDSFFDTEKDRLLRVLGFITGSRAEAEDLAQEAFARVFERWEAVGPMDDPAGYLHRTAINLFRSQHRRLARGLKRAVGLSREPDAFGTIEDRDVVSRTLASLTPRQRAALVLTVGMGMSGEEAGRALGIKASTVHALTYQARAALAGNVEPEVRDE